MKYQKPAFQVDMPGRNAVMWPKCLSAHPEQPTVLCLLEFGHKGDCESRDADHHYQWVRA